VNVVGIIDWLLLCLSLCARVFADRRARYLRVMILFCTPTQVKIFH